MGLGQLVPLFRTRLLLVSKTEEAQQSLDTFLKKIFLNITGVLCLNRTALNNVMKYEVILKTSRVKDPKAQISPPLQ